MPKPKRVALYARVSTHEKGQDPETQLRQLREYAELRGFDTVGEYVDVGSGRSEDRPEYKRLLQDARRRRLDVVLVWRYDRFARSTQALIDGLKEFQALGVDFISYQENVDTTTPQGEMVYGFLASIAQFESALISERVKAGMARAKAEGKRVSRPRISETVQGEIRSLHKAGVSVNQISKRLGVSYGTAWNYTRPGHGAPGHGDPVDRTPAPEAASPPIQ